MSGLFVNDAVESGNSSEYYKKLIEFNKSLTPEQRIFYDSLTEDEKFMYYGLSPADRVLFEKTMENHNLRKFIEANGRQPRGGKRKSRRRLKRTRKTKSKRQSSRRHLL